MLTIYRWALACTIFWLSTPLFSDILLDGGIGYRNDCFEWSIANSSGIPDVASELKWTDLRILELNGSAHLGLLGKMIVQGNASVGWILDGKNRDSDYLTSGRQEEFSRALSKSDLGTVTDLSASYGRCWSLFAGWVKIMPLVGYSFHRQELRLRKGTQVIALDPDELGPIDGLNSKYNAEWKGPWAGTAVATYLIPGWSVWGDLEYHQGVYRAKGHWNLREDFLDDFRHMAHCKGIIWKLGSRYSIGPCMAVGFQFINQRWQTKPGKDHTRTGVELFDEIGNLIGITSTDIETRLNRVQWSSWALTGQFTFQF